MTDTKDRIRVLRDRIELNTFDIKTWTRRASVEYRDKELSKCETELVAILARIAKINSDYCIANDKILENERSIDYDKKELLKLQFAHMIEKMQKLQSELTSLENNGIEIS